MQLESLSKPRRHRQRERHQTKGLMCRTMAVHVRYTSLLCRPLYKNNIKRLSSECFVERERRRLIFGIFIWTYIKV